MDNIEERVKKIVAEQLGVNEADIKNESSFVDDLGADSLDTVELVMALEEEFECEIPDDEAEKITTVQQAIDFILATRSNPFRDSSAGKAVARMAGLATDLHFPVSPENTLARRRVVITGLGLVSPVGNTVEEAWQNILAGRSGIDRVTTFRYLHLPGADCRRSQELRYHPVYFRRRTPAAWISSSITVWRPAFRQYGMPDSTGACRPIPSVSAFRSVPVSAACR